MNRRQLIRLTAVAVAAVLVIAAFLVVPMWVEVLVPAWAKRRFWIGTLRGMLGLQIALLATAPVAVIVGSVALSRARRRRAVAPVAARMVLLGVSCLFGLGLLEAGSARWYVVSHRYPVLPATFTEANERPANGPQRRIEMLVIGESSGLGIPYDRWLSVGHILAWQLERALPGSRCRVDMQAVGGSNLERMHKLLAGQARRPDCVLIYCGHNEFQARFPWERAVPYYADQSPQTSVGTRFERLGRHTYLGLAIVHALELQRLGEPPTAASKRDLVDVPAFTPGEGAEVVANYGGRLDAILTWCDQIGALPIVVVPPGNDGAFEPNRSLLRQDTPPQARSEFAREFREARRAERYDSAQAEARYRALVDRQPGFAEAHFRLGRLRVRAGDWREAQHHLTRSRDLDAMPQRCTSSLQETCRSVARRHGCVLVDGPAVLHALVPDGILDNRLFHDAHHPTFRAYTAIAQNALGQLAARRAFGWPAEVPEPTIDLDECARHFRIGPGEWSEVCRYASTWYRNEAYIRHDPSARLKRSEALGIAAQRIDKGAPLDECGTAGLGTHPDLSRPDLGPDGGDGDPKPGT